MAASRRRRADNRDPLSPAYLHARRRALTRPGDGSRVSYYEIADGTGLHVSYICRIFNRRRTSFSATTAEKIAGYLGISVDKLLALLRT